MSRWTASADHLEAFSAVEAASMDASCTLQGFRKTRKAQLSSTCLGERIALQRRILQLFALRHREAMVTCSRSSCRSLGGALTELMAGWQTLQSQLCSGNARPDRAGD